MLCTLSTAGKKLYPIVDKKYPQKILSILQLFFKTYAHVLPITVKQLYTEKKYSHRLCKHQRKHVNNVPPFHRGKKLHIIIHN